MGLPGIYNYSLLTGFKGYRDMFAGGGQIPTPQPVMTGEFGVEATYDPATGQFGLVGQGGPQVTQANPGTVVIPNHVIEAAVRADPGMIQRIFNPQGAQPPQPVAQAGPQMMAGPGGQPMPAMAAGGQIPPFDQTMMALSQQGTPVQSSTPWYQKAAAWGQSPEGQNSLRLASNFGAALAPNNQAVQGLNGAMNQNYQSGAFGRQMQNNLGGPVSATQTQPMGGGQPGGKTGSGPGQSLANTQMRPDTGNIFNPQRNFNQGAAAAGSVSPFGAPALNYNPVPGLSPQDQVAALNGSLNMRQQSMLEQQMMAEQQAAMIEAQRPQAPITEKVGDNLVQYNNRTGQWVSAFTASQTHDNPKPQLVMDANGQYQWVTPGQTGSTEAGVKGVLPQSGEGGPKAIQPAAASMIEQYLATTFLPDAKAAAGEAANFLSPFGGTDEATVRNHLTPEDRLVWDQWRQVLINKYLAGEDISGAIRQLQAERLSKQGRMPSPVQDFTQPAPSLFPGNPLAGQQQAAPTPTVDWKQYLN